jgi:hypothetical protein
MSCDCHLYIEFIGHKEEILKNETTIEKNKCLIKYFDRNLLFNLKTNTEKQNRKLKLRNIHLIRDELYMHSRYIHIYTSCDYFFQCYKEHEVFLRQKLEEAEATI